MNIQTKLIILRILGLGIAVTLMGSAIFGILVPKPAASRVYIGKTEVSVAIADTPRARERGLSGRKKLENNEGMLFVFPESDRYGFWMKAMRFPIDIIWFDSNYRIVFVKEDAQPSSYPEVFTSSESAKFVLEVPGGFFAQHHLKIGDVIKIDK